MNGNIFEEVGDVCVKCVKCVLGCIIYCIYKDEVILFRGFLDLMRLNV